MKNIYDFFKLGSNAHFNMHRGKGFRILKFLLNLILNKL